MLACQMTVRVLWLLYCPSRTDGKLTPSNGLSPEPLPCCGAAPKGRVLVRLWSSSRLLPPLPSVLKPLVRGLQKPFLPFFFFSKWCGCERSSSGLQASVLERVLALEIFLRRSLATPSPYPAPQMPVVRDTAAVSHSATRLASRSGAGRQAGRRPSQPRVGRCHQRGVPLAPVVLVLSGQSLPEPVLLGPWTEAPTGGSQGEVRCAQQRPGGSSSSHLQSSEQTWPRPEAGTATALTLDGPLCLHD